MVGCGGWYYLSHIEETPLTGRKRFVALTHQQILKIAEEERAKVEDGERERREGVSESKIERGVRGSKKVGERGS